MNQETFVMSRWLKVRLLTVGFVVLIGFVLIGVRAYDLQVHEAERMKAMAEDQYLRDIELPPRRGRVLDRQGAELAASAEVDSIYANPRLVGSNAPKVAKALAQALGLDRKDLEKRLSQRRYFSWLKRRVSPEEAREVRELGIKGVYLAREPRRYYPNRGLAGPLLGWAGVDAVGQEGLELQYDKWLRGAKIAVAGLRDALGREVMSSGVGDMGPSSGHDVWTTIDRHIQFRLESALEKGVQEHRAKAAVAVAMDPNTGEVLALASVPSVNPNEPEGARERGVRNRAVTDPFEPGSTMKTFTLAGALEARVIGANDHWYCENGRFTVGPATIHDAHPVADATTTEVLARSSNICTAKIAARQGRERLHDAFDRFGFGHRSGIDLPGERTGQLRDATRMGPVETATIAFGQGMTATPLQIASGYAAIANGGTWHRPHVLRYITNGRGAEAKVYTGESHQATTPEVAATLRKMLYAVTQKGGTAETLSVPGYTFAGKTGTAQKVDPATRRYSTDKWASSFVGFAPAEKPRLVLFVMVDEPQGTHYGGQVAGPVFAETMADALRWLGVPPNAPVAPPIADAQTPQKRTPVAATIPTLPEDSLIDAQGEAANLELADESKTSARLPDFSGMSISEVLSAARQAGVRVEVIGSGAARSQSPGPGMVRRGSACRVSFAPSG